MNKHSNESLATIDLTALDTVTGGFWGEGKLKKAWNATKDAVKGSVEYVKQHPDILIQNFRRADRRPV